MKPCLFLDERARHHGTHVSCVGSQCRLIRDLCAVQSVLSRTIVAVGVGWRSASVCSLRRRMEAGRGGVVQVAVAPTPTEHG